MKKNSFFKMGFYCVRPLFFLATVWTVFVTQPVSSLAGSLSQRERVADNQSGEILSEKNAGAGGDGRETLSDPQPNGAIQSKDDGSSNEKEISTDDEDEDIRNGPDDPE